MAALFGGNHLGLWNVLPDAAAQAAIVERVNAFWHDHVLDGVPPEPGPGDPDAELVRKLYPVSDPGKEVLYEDHAKDVDHWRRVYLQTSGEIKSLEGDKQEAANHLKHIMGDGEVMFLPDGKKLTWKNNRPSKRLDIKTLQKELPEVFDEYSEEVPGARVLRVPKPRKSK
jgi:predicted phage-related endonuclease